MIAVGVVLVPAGVVSRAVAGLTESEEGQTTCSGSSEVGKLSESLSAALRRIPLHRTASSSETGQFQNRLDPSHADQTNDDDES